ncbi:uncharacterized protein LOC129593848 isoform X2 [Paramacrobiotus metropolitanus]|uniref:uncharacterized protein LOC129593848 isoform X2 n=1 Tax=Paramacrobiotus metropolitanus TaxID=2943436 RepID=UPI002445F1B0|nr:uncharacterized protein LOC129593848 isoform X2 [Paramacrobiotus metropolitanus]
MEKSQALRLPQPYEPSHHAENRQEFRIPDTSEFGLRPKQPTGINEGLSTIDARSPTAIDNGSIFRAIANEKSSREGTTKNADLFITQKMALRARILQISWCDLDLLKCCFHLLIKISGIISANRVFAGLSEIFVAVEIWPGSAAESKIEQHCYNILETTTTIVAVVVPILRLRFVVQLFLTTEVWTKHKLKER